MQGFYNKVYDNAHEIFGWDTNKGKKNAERGNAVMADASYVGTWGGIMSEGEEDGTWYVLTYTHLPLEGRIRAHNNIKHNRDSEMDTEKKI